MTYFFTSDQHFGHNNILKYSNRPFTSIQDHDEELIKRHNEIVTNNDVVIHAGDFTLIPSSRTVYKLYVNRLLGQHIFLKGSHDRWLSHNNYLFHKTIEKQHVVVCHYAMRTWHRSHYNAFHLYGHSHGKLAGIGKSIDIGVDTNDFYPYSFDQVAEIMKNKPDNFNFIKKENRNEACVDN